MVRWIQGLNTQERSDSIEPLGGSSAGRGAMQLTQKHEGHASPKLGPLEDAARLSNWLCFRERRYEKMGCVGGKPASASGRRSSRAADLSFSANYKLGNR